MTGFETWFARFRDRHRGWEVDQQKTWLKAAWDAGFASAAPAAGVPDAITAWADDARISASEFMALSEDKRRAILDQYCDRLDGEQS
jgi:hypothetical protein